MNRRLAALVLLATVTLSAQQTPTFTEAPVYVTAIDLITEVRDRSGKVPMDLGPADFVVLEDGKEKPVIGVEYLGAVTAPAATPASSPANPQPPTATPDWQIVVYFDCVLSSETIRRDAAQSIIDRLDELTRLGTVEIVVADPMPALELQASRDRDAIRTALNNVITKHGRPNWLVQHRRQFLYERDLAAGQTGTAFTAIIRPYIQQELEIIGRFQRSLTEWMSRYPRHAPRTLMLISDGFELDPMLFYVRSAPNVSSVVQLQREASQFNTDAGNDKTAQLLASAGWTTISIPGSTGSGGQWGDDASRSGFGRTRDFIRARPGQSAPTFLLSHARQPLQHFADATGGSVLASPKQLDEAVVTLSQRVKVTYQVSRPPDGTPRKVEIRAKRPGLRVRTTQWASSTTPEEVAAARVAGLLRGHNEKGELPTTARIEWVTKERGENYGGLLFVSTDLHELEPLLRDAKPSFRVTIAARGTSGQAFAVHRIVTNWDPNTLSLAYSAPVTAPYGKISIAVTVEELGSGAWGATVVESK